MAGVSQRTLPHPPRRIPVLGDVLGMDPVTPMQATAAMLGRLGPIYQRRILRTRLVFVGGADLVAQVCDETAWDKHVGRPLQQLRPIGGDGLFTVDSDDPAWAHGHRVLAPGFTAEAMRGYHDRMVQVAGELVDSWAGAAGPLDVSEQMTRLTFETIGRIGFGYRFGSFDGGAPDPFVAAMTRALAHAQSAGLPIPGLGAVLGRRARARNAADIALLEDTVAEVIAARRAAGPGPGPADLLDRMLTTVDPETGQGLDDANIVRQTLTFLIAGHETTAGALAFCLWHLATEPGVLDTARAEVDAMFPAPGDERTISYAQVPRLRYLRRVIDESLRLWPTAPGFFRRARVHTRLAGRYDFAPGDWVLVAVNALHRDPAAWGPEPDRFDPDRFTSAQIRARHPHAFKPFGTGARACIGRQFAYHEMLIALAMIVRRFDLDADPDYRLRVAEQLTMRPEGFRLAVRPRR